MDKKQAKGPFEFGDFFAKGSDRYTNNIHIYKYIHLEAFDDPYFDWKFGLLLEGFFSPKIEDISRFQVCMCIYILIYIYINIYIYHFKDPSLYIVSLIRRCIYIEIDDIISSSV